MNKVEVAYINTKLVNYEFDLACILSNKTHNLLYCFFYVNDWHNYLFLRNNVTNEAVRINWFGESICSLLNCWNVTFESKQG